MRTLCRPLFVAAVLSVALLLPSLAADEAPPDPRMSEAERSEMLSLLADTEQRLLELIATVNEAQWRWKPAPERWSVGECAEHIVRTERGLFANVEQALAQPVDPDWHSKTGAKTEFIKRVMPDRSGRAQAPQEVRPEGKMTRDEVLGMFREHRARVLQFVEQDRSPLKQHVVTHPFPVFGDLNAYDWLIYVPLHTLRHSKQIAEVQQTPGYPAE